MILCAPTQYRSAPLDPLPIPPHSFHSGLHKNCWSIFRLLNIKREHELKDIVFFCREKMNDEERKKIIWYAVNKTKEAKKKYRKTK